MTDKILIVDDDPNILEGYKRFLRRQFKIDTAPGGEAGLAMIQEHGPYAVIVSDMRMPGMNGTQFLAKARKLLPDTPRILLTGQADLKDAIAVINEGHVFRFLSKPCPPEIFAVSLNDGIKQYQLAHAEKELLEKTLKGSIKLLMDVLLIVRPDAFSMSTRIRNMAIKIADRLNYDNKWEVDLAALFSQIGCVTLPSELITKKYRGEVLDEDETAMFSKHPQIGRDLLANIPRLENVAKAVVYQEKNFDGSGLPKDEIKGADIPIMARILKVLIDFDELKTTGKTTDAALIVLHGRKTTYDPRVISALEAEILMAEQGFIVRDLLAKDIEIGMVLAQDIKTRTGTLLVPKHHEISKIIRYRILNFAQKDNVLEPIKVLDIAT